VECSYPVLEYKGGSISWATPLYFYDLCSLNTYDGLGQAQ